MSITGVVAITGCDSGLGWALAARSAREGLVTIAGMFRGTDTSAAEALRGLCAHPFALDVTKAESVVEFKGFVDGLLKDNPNYKLHAVVNNAGVMTIGNFEWQTSAMIEDTINVNLLGAMRVTKAFLPTLRKSSTNTESARAVKPRIINVASHCGLQPLPGFAAYSASKAGVLSFTRALRQEHRGITAVAFIPGGFVHRSNILEKQAHHGQAMIESLSEEQKIVYEKQISTLTSYLSSVVPTDARFDSMKEEKIIETFMKALTEEEPAELYKVESWRYKFYYNLMKLPFPETARDWLVKKFVNFPEIK